MNTGNIIPFYKFNAAAGEEPASAELLIFDVIGDWEELGMVSAQGFSRDLAALPKSVKRLDIHINSPGGSVSEANAIYSRLADHASNKIIYVDGMAASAASLIAMVGHKIYIRANATMMIHNPMGISMGTADDMRTMAAALESHAEGMLNLYQKRSGQPRETIAEWMRAETWMSAQQAVEKGFADEVRGVVKAAAVVGEKRVMINGATFDLSRFHNVPAFIATAEQQQTNTNMNPNPQANAEATPPTAPTPPAQQPTPPAQQPTPPTPPAQQPTPPAPAQQPTPPAAATVSFQDGVTAERERIAALTAYDRPFTHDLITAAIKDGKTVTDIMPQLFAAMENNAGQQARRTDAQHMEQVPPSAADGTRSTEAETKRQGFAKDLTNNVKALVRGRQPLRAPADTEFSRN